MLAACASSGSTPEAPSARSSSSDVSAASPTGPTPETSGSALARTGLDPCALVTTTTVGRLAGRPIRSTSTQPTSFVLPGLRKISAVQCVYQVRADTHITRIKLRVSKDAPDALFQALARFDTSGITRLQSAPDPSIEGFWQSVGRTMWLRDATMAVSVEIVTDAEMETDFRLARAIAVAALIARH